VTRRPERRAAGEPRPVRTAGSARAVSSGRGVRRIGLYPGTFDPITNGHLDIIGRAVKLVDKLIIGVAINRDKGPLFSLEERVDMVMRETRQFANGVEIEARPFENLLMHFAEDCGAGIIIRGLRAVSDFEYEFQMVAMNQKMNDDIETVFLMADPVHQAVSSKLVKEIARLGGRADLFVPEDVNQRLAAKFGSKK
jgi:pantetheine-phosphate adenylyltransferase